MCGCWSGPAGKVQPTAAGVALLEPARRAQAAIEDAVAAVAAHRQGRPGVSASAPARRPVSTCCHPILSAVKRRMPGLELVIATGNSADMARHVETGELDIALVTLPVTRSRALSVTRLMPDPLVALLPASLARDCRAYRQHNSPALPLILYETGGTTRAIIDAWFRRAGVTPSPIMQLDSIETIKVLVSGGLGASIMPAMALAVPPTQHRGQAVAAGDCAPPRHRAAAREGAGSRSSSWCWTRCPAPDSG